MSKRGQVLRWWAACACVAVFCQAAAAGPTTRPVQVRPVEAQTPDGPVRGWVARVDLERATIVVAAPAPRFSTPAWAEAADVALAVNANYFGASEPIGLAVSDGRVLSPARGVDPVLLIGRTRARVVVGEAPSLEGVEQAVAGVGATERAPLGAALLVGGESTAAGARVAANERHPRTAAGVDASGRILILMAIDGRQPDWSVGVTLPELAGLMLDAGATDAINLDGGGSTAFAFRDASGGWRTNQPSDGEFRPVAVHLGVRGEVDDG